MESKVFVVIPAYNADRKIRGVVDELKRGGYAIVVVDDGSTDSTFQEARKTTAHVLRHVVNRGQGAALATGVQYAFANGADVLVHFDADGQHRAVDAERMIDRLSKGDIDVVLGSRVMGGMDFDGVDALKLQGKRLVDRLFSGVALTDVHNGLRVMNRRAAELIEISQDRMAHATEIVSEIRRHGLRYEEFPVVAPYTEYSRVNSTNKNFLKASLKIVKDLVVGKMVK